ncbi:HNH endonuclease [Gemmobacter fulvus]|uniref:HNH endonuclease n=1 Tax=Gemmobacter fulvus TaxID=2840474 RepID=UPI00279657A1|nr:HNH endonuclease [Gemmobacter fulvus]MDQ1847704.1 HNH endonuclease [Gemmobacter fulvus]
MSALAEHTANLSEVHVRALTWFHDNRGRRVSWQEMKKMADDEGVRLSTAAKGIYKPSYTEYTLSVRTVQDGPYPDKEVEYRPDGSWVCQYFQEYTDVDRRDKSAGNRGLLKCQKDRVPVGFLIKRQDKPAEYDVLGLGLVTNWDRGYFTIEGFADNGAFRPHVEHDAASMRANAVDAEARKDIQSAKDARNYALVTIARRRGQAAFRNTLLKVYNSKCCITGCDFVPALEAAHIRPYLGEHSNIASNGLLLRGDIHTLFDLGFLAIGDQYNIILAKSLASSDAYHGLYGKRISLPSHIDDQPDREFLRNHREWAGFE